MLYSLLLQDSIAFRAIVPASSAAGEPVAFGLRLTNRTERPLALPLVGQPPVFDIAVSRDDGTVVWRRPAEGTNRTEWWTRTLEPAETLAFDVTWDCREAGGPVAPPGVYRVTGSLPTGGAEDLVTLPATLRLVPAR